MSAADVAGILTGAGYSDVVTGDVADRAWRVSDEGAGLRAVILDPTADARARLLAAEVLARHWPGPDELPADALARAYVDGLRAGAFAELANPWGVPGGPLGSLGERVLSLGAAAIEPLADALEDGESLRFAGPREATIGNSYGWRVKDVAAWVLAELIGGQFEAYGDPARRDAAIEKLGRQVEAGDFGGAR